MLDEFKLEQDNIGRLGSDHDSATMLTGDPDFLNCGWIAIGELDS